MGRSDDDAVGASSGEVDFALLGPLEVRRDGELIDVRRGLSRLLLTVLVLRVGRTVPGDQLIEQLWGARPPGDAANALPVQVSYLRRALRLPANGSAPALRTVGGGYQLDVDPARVDLFRFEHAVTAVTGRPGGVPGGVAVELLVEVRAALGLWRGDPLQDVMYDLDVAADIERLLELRVMAEERELQALLDLGHHELAIPMARRLVDNHPLREGLQGQLIVALYRAGRQADALRAYDAARQRLIEELGAEPGADLQRIHRGVLDHNKELSWSPTGDGGPRGTEAGEPVGPLGSTVPAPTTGMLAREREMVRVSEVLLDDRIVTLIGPGGAGKTRLALELANDQPGRPTWWVELAAVDDDADVLTEIARAVGVTPQANPLDGLAARIGPHPALIVLDTCEHLAAGCSTAIQGLLRRCPQLRVLATSRQPLAIAGEVAWPVQPLPVPAMNASFDEIAGSDAVRLFRERCRSVLPDFDLEPGNATAVASICRTLDGLPLAIELAASRIRVLSPAAMVDRLGDRFALLHRTGAAAEVRQRSLLATIEWSYDLLDDEQQRFFSRMGVFAGRFCLDAATAVGAPGIATDPLELVSAMVDRSLVVSDGDDTFRMLDSLRAFARHRLDDCPAERAASQHRLATWLVECCEGAAPRLRGHAQEATLDRLAMMVPDLRATLAWSFSSNPAIGVRLARSLVWFWALEAANDEAVRWLRQANYTINANQTRREPQPVSKIASQLGASEMSGV